MTIRKSVTLVTLLLFLFSLLAGCYSDPGNRTNEAANLMKKDLKDYGKNNHTKHKLTFWTMQQADINIKSAQQEAVKDFEAASDCAVEVTSFPYVELQDRMLIAVASGRGPDVLLLDQIWVPQYAAAKFIVPIDDLLQNSKIKEDDYFKVAWEAGKYLGKTYAIPFDVGVWAVLYYNKMMFKEAGLDPEKPPQTWSQFLKVGRQLTKNGKYGTAVWVGAEPVQCMTDAFIFSAGGKIVDNEGKRALLNSEAGVKALEFWKACAEISPPGTVGRGEEDSFKLFTSERIAMFFYGEWGQDTIKTRAPDMDYGVALLPRPDGGQSIGTFGGYNLGINTNCRNKELVWDFIQFATSKKVEKKITMLTPAHKEAAMEYLKEKRKYSEVIFQQLSNSSLRPAVPNYPEISAVQKIATQKILLNQMTTKDALDEAASKIDELLKK